MSNPGLNKERAMAKFKVGDTVRCVRNECVEGTLSVDWEYRVVGLHGGCIRVNVGSSFAFDEDRFELVVAPKTEPKVNPTYTVRWYYKGNDGELTFGTKEGALGFTSMFHDDVPYSVTKDVDVDVGGV
jgi:hypothetical protein